MTGSSSLWMGPGALPLTALNVRVRVFSTFLSFFAVAGTVPTALVEFRLETRPNSSESSMEGFCDLGGDVVVARERENRLGMGGRGEMMGPKRRSKAKKGETLTTVVVPSSAFDYVSSKHTQPSPRPHTPTSLHISRPFD